MWLMFAVRGYMVQCAAHVYVAYVPTICVHYESLQSFLLGMEVAHLTIINVMHSGTFTTAQLTI